MKQPSFTNGQMAALSGVKNENQWSKYTGINLARNITVPVAFYLVVHTTLNR